MIISYDEILTKRGLLGNKWKVIVRRQVMSGNARDSRRVLKDGDEWDIGSGIEFRVDVVEVN
jgi:hypothetical protein